MQKGAPQPTNKLTDGGDDVDGAGDDGRLQRGVAAVAEALKELGRIKHDRVDPGKLFREGKGEGGKGRGGCGDRSVSFLVVCVCVRSRPGGAVVFFCFVCGGVCGCFGRAVCVRHTERASKNRAVLTPRSHTRARAP